MEDVRKAISDWKELEKRMLRRGEAALPETERLRILLDAWPSNDRKEVEDEYERSAWTHVSQLEADLDRTLARRLRERSQAGNQRGLHNLEEDREREPEAETWTDWKEEVDENGELCVLQKGIRILS